MEHKNLIFNQLSYICINVCSFIVLKGEVNGGFMGDAQSVAGSRKSLNLHPVLLMPQPGDADRYSEFSNRTGRSKTSAYRAEYASSMQNFQL